ncbi:hypothetical protein [Hominifimenecus sp. rT4P-3]|uniref:hypothetical protein n=1 Tax=Hominifimenecus sp. rT4P-3 TaxID=3242979 RepID=UPI003DA589ED
MRKSKKVVLAGMAVILLFGTLVYAKTPNSEISQQEAECGWYESGRRQGLYTNPALAHTVGNLFQNETLDNILAMSRDERLPEWRAERFFQGTVFQNLTVEDLESFYEQGFRDMEELLPVLGY